MFLDDPQRHSSVDLQSYPYGDRRLNTAEAQSYVCAIQVQFHDQPDVYNQFLGLLQEFKLERINATGLIKAVLQLFNGRLPLMQDFNTFLPAGYRINCSPDDSSNIIVTTPTGTTMHTTDSSLRRGSLPGSAIDTPSDSPDSQSSRSQSPTEPQRYPSIDRPVNVTDALRYLDTIKAQFHDQPDVYNQFLKVLVEYKNDLINTSDLIKLVLQLFNDHLALIQGFNTFLPVGYSIGCSPDGSDNISVITPVGAIMHTTDTNADPCQGPIRSTGPAAGLSIPPVLESNVRPPSREADNHIIEPATQHAGVESRFDPEAYSQLQDTLNLYRQQPGMFDEKDLLQQIACLVDGLFVKIK